MNVTVRPEAVEDFPAIRSVVEQAFENMPFAAGDEADLVETLRAQHALLVSLVAEIDGEVIGHIAFSPATASGPAGEWYALGPVAVLPRLQGEGIGATLVRAGLREIELLGAAGCILTGDPDYYVRFGFEVTPECAPPEEPAEYFMVKVLRGAEPRAPIGFHPAFHSDPA